MHSIKGVFLTAAGVIRIDNFIRDFCIIALLGASLLMPGLANSEHLLPETTPSTATLGIVGKVYFSGRYDLNGLAQALDIWEVNHKEGFLVAFMHPDQYAGLLQKGYRIEIHETKTALYNAPAQIFSDTKDGGIPGYPCYRTVEETFSSMQNLGSEYPNLVSLLDVGDSWEKITPGGAAGYDILTLVLSNKSVTGQKPRLFILAETHAREYATAEAALRFAEHLLAGYNVDPDITWLLDSSELHILPIANPDGRKLAESGISWRKNTDNDDGCINPPYWGVDLNRNHSFKWGCCGGSSSDPCAATYRGPLPASEPEIQAIQSYVASIFPDQRGPGDADPAPDYVTGLLITLHSYGELVLWPWGWTATYAPNADQLQTLGRKLAYLNGYIPQQSYWLYRTDGSTDDWAYGQLGIAAYTIEMGTDFFQDCRAFEDSIYPLNTDALLYALKAARMPYKNPAGPDSLNVTVSSAVVVAGATITLRATADDTRFSAERGVEPAQKIVSARYTVDNTSWIENAVAYPMVASDGFFNSTVEDVVATVNTTGWVYGRHTIFVESQDEDGNWGVPTALFITIVDHLPQQTKVRVKPGRVSFGNIKAGVSVTPRNIMVTNKGKKDMEILSVELQGPHQSDFSYTHDCVGQYLPGGFCAITVSVHPSALGKREATLVIVSNDSRKATKDIPLRAHIKP